MALVTANHLFIHVPKTGGTTVRAMFRELGLNPRESGPFEIEDHYTLPQIAAAHPELLPGRVTFGFVRHPVAWLKSRWAWAMTSGFGAKLEREAEAANHWMASCWSDDFDDFVAAYLERFPGIATQTMFKALGLWSAVPAGYIGRTERLVSDVEAVLGMGNETFNRRAVAEFVDRRYREAAYRTLAREVVIGAVVARRICYAEPVLCGRFGYD
jgi:hypothetical protein